MRLEARGYDNNGIFFIPVLVDSFFDREPPRHPVLTVNSKEPFNAETPRSALIDSYVTSMDMFYKRNHELIPVLDDSDRYCVTVGGSLPKHLAISMDDIRMLPKYTILATLQCAGNRRTKKNIQRPSSYMKCICFQGLLIVPAFHLHQDSTLGNPCP